MSNESGAPIESGEADGLAKCDIDRCQAVAMGKTLQRVTFESFDSIAKSIQDAAKSTNWTKNMGDEIVLNEPKLPSKKFEAISAGWQPNGMGAAAFRDAARNTV